jgi:1-acyl-sn-glycerol-3-phosphate acyltransferase
MEVPMLYWILKYVVIGPILRLVYRPQVQGLEHLPADGAAILASNHLSFSDSIFLPLVCKRRITFLAKSDYFTGKGLKGWLTKVFMAGVGQVSVDRSGGSASEGALDTGLAILAEGQLLGIYPEGTRSGDGRLYRGKTGVARMALEAGVPVIPCAMINTNLIQPPGRLRPRIMRVRIAIGEPLDFSRYEGMSGDRFVLRSMTDEIMYELMELSGQEYVDMYAARAKAQQAGARDGSGGASVNGSGAGLSEAGSGTMAGTMSGQLVASAAAGCDLPGAIPSQPHPQEDDSAPAVLAR